MPRPRPSSSSGWCATDAYLDTIDSAIAAYEPFIEALRSEDGPEFTTLMAMAEQVEKITKRGNAAVAELDAPACVDES